MVIVLALVSAVLFALAAALQQRGQFTLARSGVPVSGVGGLARMLLVPVWLLGTLLLLVGYGTQAAALDGGRLVVIQPLLVTTIVWALPLGHWLTGQHVDRRQVGGAAIVVVGLGLFIAVGDPDAGVDDTADWAFLVAMLVIGALVAMLAGFLHRTRAPARRAALLGVCAGLLFGLAATLAKPVIETLHEGLAATAADWRTWALLGIGLVAFLLQQLSLATGQLAPAMAAVSVSNPAISVVLGIALFDERLTGTGWQIVVAVAALFAALAGAVAITLANRDVAMTTGAGPGEPA